MIDTALNLEDGRAALVKRVVSGRAGAEGSWTARGGRIRAKLKQNGTIHAGVADTLAHSTFAVTRSAGKRNGHAVGRCRAGLDTLRKRLDIHEAVWQVSTGVVRCAFHLKDRADRRSDVLAVVGWAIDGGESISHRARKGSGKADKDGG